VPGRRDRRTGGGGRVVTAEQRGWYMYDWANSAFQTSVVTVFAGPYLTAAANAAADPSGFVHPLGLAVRAAAFYPSLVALAALLQVLAMPLVGLAADRSRRRRRLLGTLAYLGALATLGLSLAPVASYLAGAAMFVVASIAHGCSTVVYNAFLPRIASLEQRDLVSSRGWALGYLGGGIVLVLNLVVFQLAGTGAAGIDRAGAVRIGIAAAAVWWAAFTVVPMATLPDGARPALPGRLRAMGVAQLKGTINSLRAAPATLRFLGAYLCFSIGIQTVISQSAVFASRELELTQSTIITAVLLVQFVGVAGTWLLGLLAGAVGAKRVILGSLAVWTGVLAYAYLMSARDAASFYVLATAIGFVLGGTQALSRSLFSQMVPRGSEAEYFSWFEIASRGTSWLGALLFGLVLQLGGTFRLSILSLVLFFASGLVLLARTRIRQAVAEARDHIPVRV
jgi:UMF1 family MFS transporter